MISDERVFERMGEPHALEDSDYADALRGTAAYAFARLALAASDFLAALRAELRR